MSMAAAGMAAPQAAPSAADLAAVEAVVRAAGTSFYRGMRILPPERRAAMYAIYAFCRIVDDIADEPGTLAAKRAALAQWRARIHAICAGEPGADAIERALGHAIARFALREADFLAVIDGMESDAQAAIIAPDEAELDLYCDRVAAAVGRLSVRAFGDASARADEVAHHLGRALQLTNILRDLAEDAARGRLYLPAEALARYGVPADPRRALQHPGMAALCSEIAVRAQAHFTAAYAAMALCNPAAMRPARAMAASYHAVLAQLRRRGWHDLTRPAPVPRWKKLWIALRYAVAN